MGLHRIKTNIPIDGIGSTTIAKGMVDLKLLHRSKESEGISIRALVVTKISSRLPDRPFNAPFSQLLPDDELADPLHSKPGNIDLLLGAGVWATIVRSDIMRNDVNGLHAVAQRTTFGWVIYGQIASCSYLRIRSCHVSSDIDDARLDRMLLKFWNADGFPVRRQWTPDEQRAEEIFMATHRRADDGRYIVRIPLRTDVLPLGNSRRSAKACFHSVERKLQGNPNLHGQYKAVFDDYRASKHMVLAPEKPVNDAESYYMPHHAINPCNNGQQQRKFRVVFNASAASDNGISYNEQQLPGPKLQDDLSEIFLRFRMKRYGLTADIKQMFRQINVNALDWNHQRVIWRDAPSDPLQEYIITVVTWGMTSAGFNAVRALRQCAVDEQHRFPTGSKIALKDFYFDDLLTGADEESELMNAYHEITDLLSAGKFELAKWTTNSPMLTAEIKKAQPTEVDVPIECGILGMRWIQEPDMLRIKVDAKLNDIGNEQLTKRKIMSATAQIYDPSGLVMPVVVTGKILQQDLWRSGVDWDGPIPTDLLIKWREYKQNVMALDQIRISRWVRTDAKTKLQLHIFTDASEQAMGACAYIRAIDTAGTISVHLLTSKSKVTPVKKMTIPRLELAASLIGAELYQSIKKACGFDHIDTYFWTDSMIVKYWIQRDPSLNKPYVANRVLAVRQKAEGGIWRHVIGTQNPADLVTRGISATQLAAAEIWWHGPKWLADAQGNWPIPPVTPITPMMADAIRQEGKIDGPLNTETNKDASVTIAKCIIGDIAIQNLDGQSESLVNRRSDLASLLRTTGYVLRFIRHLKSCVNKRSESAEQRIHQPIRPVDRATIPAISSVERTEAMLYWIRLAQNNHYSDEIKRINRKESVSRNSPIIKLAPFVDEQGLLKVGGRLAKANIPTGAKHQLILPPKARITALIIRDAHFVTLHGGPNLMMAHLRRRFWITKMGQILKSMVHKCPTCIRYDQPPNDQLMGNLPSARVNEAEPFQHTGVDFAGPFLIRKSPGRPASERTKPAPALTVLKAWIVIFVCMATRATHIDVIIGLTIEEFMAAFERLVMRKGRVQHLYSDNGTTFVGTDKELSRILKLWEATLPEHYLAKYNTKWHFITPASPHKGGVWEAAVKSMKKHMKKSVGKQTLTKDQLYQLSVQIEGCLNSRPLWPMSDDVNDPMPLTPAHFVLGKPILPQPLSEDVADLPQNRLTMWRQKQQMHQQIWRRWREEYLATLQQRTKWYNIKANMKVGDMVIIREENLPPAHWCMGKVAKTYHADDGLVRSALIKTATGELERPINKLCFLAPPTNSG